MKRKHNFLKIVSLLLIGAFCLQEVSYSAPAPPYGGFGTPLEVLLQDPTRFQAPLDFSTLKEIHKGTSGTFIIHIQDAHSNLSGQENLANTLDAIMTKYNVSLILSEGGAEDCSLTSIKKIAPPEVWKRLAKSYLIQGKITGEEYLNLVSDHPMKIIGLEDLDLYFKSVRNYAKLADKRQEILEYLKTIDSALSKLKHKLYPAELISYEDKKKNEGKDDRTNLFEADFKGLLELARGKNIDLAAFPNVMKLVELQLKEKFIDFNLANLEQAALVEEISKHGGGEDLQGFLKKIDQMKNKKVSQYAYFENTFRIAKEKGILFTQYPNLMKYGEYLKDFSQVDLDQLLDELAKVEDKVYVALLPQEDQRLIRSIDRFLGLLHTAYNIQMSTKEFNLFKANEPDFSTMSYLSFINQKLAELGYFEDLIPYKNLLEEGKQSLEAFYDSVSQRDFEFMKNTEKVLNAENQKVAVLITGGYHTSHLKKLFQEKGYSYAVLTPIVTAETNQQKYEKQLLSPIKPEIKRVEIVQGERKNDKSLSLLENDLIKDKKNTDGVRQVLIEIWRAGPGASLNPGQKEILLAQKRIKLNFEQFLKDALTAALRYKGESPSDDEIDKRVREILTTLSSHHGEENESWVASTAERTPVLAARLASVQNEQEFYVYAHRLANLLRDYFSETDLSIKSRIGNRSGFGYGTVKTFLNISFRPKNELEASKITNVNFEFYIEKNSQFPSQSNLSPKLFVDVRPSQSPRISNDAVLAFLLSHLKEDSRKKEFKELFDNLSQGNLPSQLLAPSKEENLPPGYKIVDNAESIKEVMKILEAASYGVSYDGAKFLDSPIGQGILIARGSGFRDHGFNIRLGNELLFSIGGGTGMFINQALVRAVSNDGHRILLVLEDNTQVAINDKGKIQPLNLNLLDDTLNHEQVDQRINQITSKYPKGKRPWLGFNVGKPAVLMPALILSQQLVGIGNVTHFTIYEKAPDNLEFYVRSRNWKDWKPNYIRIRLNQKTGKEEVSYLLDANQLPAAVQKEFGIQSEKSSDANGARLAELNSRPSPEKVMDVLKNLSRTITDIYQAYDMESFQIMERQGRPFGSFVLDLFQMQTFFENREDLVKNTLEKFPVKIKQDQADYEKSIRKILHFSDQAKTDPRAKTFMEVISEMMALAIYYAATTSSREIPTFPENSSGGATLDIASGLNFGQYIPLLKSDREYIAVDKSPFVVSILRRVAELSGMKNVTVLEEDLLNLKFGKKFGLIRSKNVTAYVKGMTQEKWLEIAGWLKEGGQLVFQNDANEAGRKEARKIEKLAKHLMDEGWAFNFELSKEKSRDGAAHFGTLMFLKPGQNQPQETKHWTDYTHAQFLSAKSVLQPSGSQTFRLDSGSGQKNTGIFLRNDQLPVSKEEIPKKVLSLLKRQDEINQSDEKIGIYFFNQQFNQKLPFGGFDPEAPNAKMLVEWISISQLTEALLESKLPDIQDSPLYNIKNYYYGFSGYSKLRPIIVIGLTATGARLATRLDAELARLVEDPTGEKTLQGQRDWLATKITEANSLLNLFNSNEVSTLADSLVKVFVRRFYVDKGYGRYSLMQDMGSGATIAEYDWGRATGGLIRGKMGDDIEKKKMIAAIMNLWDSEFRMGRNPDDNQVTLTKFRTEITQQYPKINLSNTNVSSDRIETTIFLLKLLPSSFLMSQEFVHRLRGGINLAAERDESTRVAQYVEETGELGVQPTIMTIREFVEAFLHEFGHVVQEKHLKDAEFQDLFQLTKGEMYELPSSGFSGKTKASYINRDAEEFFAETFMHYILHGRQMKEGFRIAGVKTPELWERVYSYYKEKVFGGVEYSIFDGKLTVVTGARMAEDINVGQPSRQDMLTVLNNLKVPVIESSFGDLAFGLLLSDLQERSEYLRRIYYGEDLSAESEKWTTLARNIGGNVQDVQTLSSQLYNISLDPAQFFEKIGIDPTQQKKLIVINSKIHPEKSLFEEVMHILAKDEPNYVKQSDRFLLEILNDFVQLMFISPQHLESFSSGYVDWSLNEKKALQQRYIVETGFDPNTQMPLILKKLSDDLDTRKVSDEQRLKGELYLEQGIKIKVGGQDVPLFKAIYHLKDSNLFALHGLFDDTAAFSAWDRFDDYVYSVLRREGFSSYIVEHGRLFASWKNQGARMASDFSNYEDWKQKTGYTGREYKRFEEISLDFAKETMGDLEHIMSPERIRYYAEAVRALSAYGYFSFINDPDISAVEKQTSIIATRKRYLSYDFSTSRDLEIFLISSVTNFSLSSIGVPLLKSYLHNVDEKKDTQIINQIRTVMTRRAILSETRLVGNIDLEGKVKEISEADYISEIDYQQRAVLERALKSFDSPLTQRLVLYLPEKYTSAREEFLISLREDFRKVKEQREIWDREYPTVTWDDVITIGMVNGAIQKIQSKKAGAQLAIGWDENTFQAICEIDYLFNYYSYSERSARLDPQGKIRTDLLGRLRSIKDRLGKNQSVTSILNDAELRMNMKFEEWRKESGQTTLAGAEETGFIPSGQAVPVGEWFLPGIQTMESHYLRDMPGWGTVPISGEFRTKSMQDGNAVRTLFRSREVVAASVRSLYPEADVKGQDNIEVIGSDTNAQNGGIGLDKAFSLLTVRVQQGEAIKEYSIGILVGNFQRDSQAHGFRLFEIEPREKAFLAQSGIGPDIGPFIDEQVLVVRPVIGETLLSLINRGEWKKAFVKRLELELKLFGQGILATDSHLNNIMVESVQERPFLIDSGIAKREKNRLFLDSIMEFYLLSPVGFRDEVVDPEDLKWMAHTLVEQMITVLDKTIVEKVLTNELNNLHFKPIEAADSQAWQKITILLAQGEKIKNIDSNLVIAARRYLNNSGLNLFIEYFKQEAQQRVGVFSLVPEELPNDGKSLKAEGARLAEDTEVFNFLTENNVSGLLPREAITEKGQIPEKTLGYLPRISFNAKGFVPIRISQVYFGLLNFSPGPSGTVVVSLANSTTFTTFGPVGSFTHQDAAGARLTTVQPTVTSLPLNPISGNAPATTTVVSSLDQMIAKDAASTFLRQVRNGLREAHNDLGINRSELIDVGHPEIIAKTFTRKEWNAMTPEIKSFIKIASTTVSKGFKEGQITYTAVVINDDGSIDLNPEKDSPARLFASEIKFNLMDPQSIPSGIKVMFQGNLPDSFIRQLAKLNAASKINKYGILLTEGRINQDNTYNLLPDMGSDISTVLVGSTFDETRIMNYVGRYMPVKTPEHVKAMREVSEDATLSFFVRANLIIRRIEALTLGQIIAGARLVTKAVGGSA